MQRTSTMEPIVAPVPGVIPEVVTSRPGLDSVAVPDNAHGRRPLYAQLIAADVVAIVVTMVAILSLAGGDRLLITAVGLLPLAIMLIGALGLYDRNDLVARHRTTLDEASSLFQAVGISGLVVWLGGQLVVADGQVSREQILVLWLGLTVALMLGRVLVRTVARRTAPRQRCLIVGDGVALERFRVTLRDAGDRGIELVGHVPPHDLIDAATDETALGLLEDLPTLVRSHRVDRVIVLEGTVGHESTLELLRLAADLRLPVDLLSRFPNITDRPLAWHYRHGVALDSDGELVLTKAAAGLKRGIDIVVAALGLVLVAPVLLLAALATRVGSPGPVLFRQERVGRHGRTFELLKLRSMRVAEPGRDTAFVLARGLAPGGIEGRDRRTRVGRILRRTCIDELPQLYNALRGDMSLVGPRPERPEYVEEFSDLLSGYYRRHRLRPGLTGLAQIQGLRGQTSLSARLQTDNAYVDHWSITSDLKILLLTPHAVLRARTTV